VSPDDELERRLREVLHSRRLSIEPGADALDRIHAGARRRQQHRALSSGLAAAAVVAVVATGVALRPIHHPAQVVAGASSTNPSGTAPNTVLNRPASPGPSTALHSATKAAPAVSSAVPNVATIPAGGGLPKGFVPISVTSDHTNTFWVLGHAPCAKTTCTALTKTTDGGKTFTQVGAPPSALVPDALGNIDVFGAATVSDVRFVDSSNGWAYGGGLWQTTDGGQHWAKVSIAGSVQQLAVASGRAWAVVLLDAPAATGPSYAVYSSTYPDGTWTEAASAGRFGPAEPRLALQGGDVTVIGVESSTGTWTARTATGGSTSFSALPAPPCSAGGSGDRLSSTAGALWLACSDGAPGVFVSPDFGRSWQVAASSLSGGTVSIGAVDATSAIVAENGKLVRVNADGSSAPVSHPSVPASTVWSFVGFTTTTDGFAVGIVKGERQLWRTTDGGSHWSVVRF
jgi:photosystem II stability/assembly factor-like uncharacterized protein